MQHASKYHEDRGIQKVGTVIARGRPWGTSCEGIPSSWESGQGHKEKGVLGEKGHGCLRVPV